MATGQRAIEGEAFPELQEAILSKTLKLPGALRPGIPAKLDKVIKKCIEKDLQRRYQSASEIRSDLQQLKKQTGAFRERWWVAGVGILILAVLGFWLAKRQRAPALRPDLILRQLTANSPENNVSDGQISPDGRYLAYTDHKGLHLKAIETGETHTIPRPKEVPADFQWRCSAWSPDSSIFLANSWPPTKDPAEIADEDVSIWLIPISSRLPRKLRSRAFAGSFSPDGSQIAFGTNNGGHGPREIWLMDANGEHAHKQFESGDEGTINTITWSADGKRMVYARDRGAEVILFSRDLEGGPPVLLERPAEIKDRNIDYGITFPDGRSIFSVTEQEGTSVTDTCNFWLVRNDLRNGKLLVPPQKLTNWAGFCMDPTSVTADLKRIAFVQLVGHPTLYVADVASDGVHITNERHLTLSESKDVMAGWTADNQSIIFFSNRSAGGGIYRQRIDGDTVEPLVTRQQGLAVCCVSPDGQSVLFLENDASRANGDLMRASIAGGNPQKLFSSKNLEWWGCARFESRLCVIAERSDDRRIAVITAFDPEKGRGPEVARIALDPNLSNWSFALSPEGKRFALIRRPGAPLQILSTNGEVLQEIKIPGRTNNAPIAWAANGKALYVPVATPSGSQLLHVDLRGKVQLVRENLGGDYTFGIPSTDGRHLAIESTADNRNIWLMENF
jgi:Tol biopolymer transport system component